MKAENDDLLKEFTPEQIAELDGIIERHKGEPGALIPVLEDESIIAAFSW